MTILLAIWGGLAGFVGCMMFVASRGAVHEIEAALALLISTVAIGCAGIINALNRNTHRDFDRREKLG